MKNIIENYWKIFKNNSLQKQRDIRKLPLDEIKKIQWERLKKLLDYIYKNNEFYRDYFESANLTPNDMNKPEDMLKLPITEKKTYRKYFKKIISRNTNENDRISSCTSGSSGEPFKFYLDADSEGANLTAAFFLNEEGMGIKPFKRINEIEIKTEPRNEVKNLKEKIPIRLIDHLKYLFFLQRIGINAKDITRENVDDIVRIIRKNNIKCIYGYSSSILSLAGYFSSHNIKFNMEHIITIGESLLKQQRDFISMIFNCPVYLDYSASECMRMGSECKFQDGYHMDIYNYYFEYITNGRYAKNNETGEIIVTNLNNYVFPFIRYKIGDVAVISNRLCKCGNNLPIVREIRGRITDIIITPTGKEISSGLINVPFEHLYKYIKQYQVIQIEDNELLLKIVPTDMMTDEKLNDIEKYIYDLTDKSMKVTVKLVEEIAIGESGKKRVVVSKKEYQRLKDKGTKK